jgi:hypothetical protein
VNWVSVSNPNDHNFGSYFGSFTRTKDPQCAAVASNLQAFCTLQAVADSNGKIVLQNPQPGTRGSLGLASLTLPGNWSFDASLSKSVRMWEGKTLLNRMDSTNVLNHPNPSSPFTEFKRQYTVRIHTRTSPIRDASLKDRFVEFLRTPVPSVGAVYDRPYFVDQGKAGAHRAPPTEDKKRLSEGTSLDQHQFLATQIPAQSVESLDFEIRVLSPADHDHRQRIVIVLVALAHAASERILM